MIKLLDYQSRELERYPESLAELLERRPRSDEAIKELDRLHRERLMLLCNCGRILHVVQREYPFLRRNPGQNSTGPECPLCESSTAQGEHSAGASLARRQNVGIGFILATRTHLDGQDDFGENERQQKLGGVKNSLKYARGFSVLFTLMEGAGFTSLASTLPWKEMWGRVHDQLRNIPLHSHSHKSLADFSWTPGGFYKGGLKGLNDRLKAWDHPKIQAEGWVFAIITELPEADEILVSQVSEAMRRNSEAKGESVYPPYKITAPRHNMATVGTCGPYLMLAAASINEEGRPEFRKPCIRRVLLQSIVGEHNPAPVESSLEAEVVKLLQRRKIDFVKPVFDNAEGLRPDFVLPKERILIEVQGMSSDEYRQHKKEIHKRLIESQSYVGFNLLTYDANQGEKFSSFEERLLSCV
jgi:hypothetical protein